MYPTFDCVAQNRNAFMHTAEKEGYYKLIMEAKTDAQQLAAFAKIKTEVARCFAMRLLWLKVCTLHSNDCCFSFFAATAIQATARGKMARAAPKGAGEIGTTNRCVEHRHSHNGRKRCY